MLLSKGFEVEMYTGTADGRIVGLSDRITRDLPGFMREPDSRNVEYATAPHRSYERLICELLKPRLALRNYLRAQPDGDYTILPGSTLSLGDTSRFYRAAPDNPYHTYIAETYGTSVVTASIHINIGIPDPGVLIRVMRLIRLEAPLLLALSASSPFLDGRLTDYDSTRWGLFPQVPSQMPPLFEDHAHFIRWTDEQLDRGTMYNARHLWMSARPNGERRPYDLNRLEVRICDLVTNPLDLLAIAALLEMRVQQAIDDPSLDPLVCSDLPAGTRASDLLEIIQHNERAVSRTSLNATLRHWQDGREILARDWIAALYETVRPMARDRGIGCFLSPLRHILRDGNTSQQWRAQAERGESIAAILQSASRMMALQEQELEHKICLTALA
ncbi:MAG: glutamate--cysteine ligase [Geitlerinemataceae cyanobacterium]